MPVWRLSRTKEKCAAWRVVRSLCSARNGSPSRRQRRDPRLGRAEITLERISKFRSTETVRLVAFLSLGCFLLGSCPRVFFLVFPRTSSFSLSLSLTLSHFLYLSRMLRPRFFCAFFRLVLTLPADRPRASVLLIQRARFFFVRWQTILREAQGPMRPRALRQACLYQHCSHFSVTRD